MRKATLAKKPRIEEKMYRPVAYWLRDLLKARHGKRKVQAHVTSEVALYRWLEQKGFQEFFPEYLAYDIRVDITGIIYDDKSASLVLVECKVKPISLRDISQLLGYCRVAQPQSAWIVSPTGISRHVSCLLRTYHRYDVLKYNQTSAISVATWIHDRAEIDQSTLLPPGQHTG